MKFPGWMNEKRANQCSKKKRIKNIYIMYLWPLKMENIKKLLRKNINGKNKLTCAIMSFHFYNFVYINSADEGDRIETVALCK